MSQLAILLVHGFSGSDRDLFPLAERLHEVFGSDAVQLLQLPGHARGECLSGFDLEQLLAAIVKPLEDLRRRAETLVVLGHSTGGNLLLAALERAGVVPDLLILAATPFRIDLTYLERWQRHRLGRETLSLTTVAGLVKMINRVTGGISTPACPILLLQGDADQLVPSREAQRWQEQLAGASKLSVLPGFGHQLFRETGNEKLAEIVGHEISVSVAANEEQQVFARQLIETEPEAAAYLATHRTELRHLAMSPSGRRLLGEQVCLPECVPWNPVFANIEITTSCNLGCRHCARTLLRPADRQMSVGQFEQVLDSLPSAYRVTLVGLGEPLLHPQLPELIALAKSRGRRVGLVSNAQLLTPRRSEEILAAGLDSIAFSLDTVDPERVAELRAGSNQVQIEGNIRGFCEQANRLERPVARAVFCAVSATSLAGLQDLVDMVTDLDVHVLMVSDLNFVFNQGQSLGAQIDAQQEIRLRQIIGRAYAQGLPVLGVRALEDFGLALNYRKALLLPVEQLYRRSEQHRHCFSLWQTLSINVDGDLCLCDCQPEHKIGNLLQEKLASLWNGPAMRAQRRRIISEQPLPECAICPRF